MTYQFKIQLTGLQKPPVWRRIILPTHLTFDEFHVVIQVLFGWQDYHLYFFSQSGYGTRPFYTLPNDDDSYYDEEGDTVDSSKARISDVFTVTGKKFTYIYDFGDDWKHSILLEDIDETAAGVITCVAGKGACPPEDCGGVYGYYNLLEILKDPTHPEYIQYKEWLGLEADEEWDINYFDLDGINEELKDVFS